MDEKTSMVATAYLPLAWLRREPLAVDRLLLRYGAPARVEYHGSLAPLGLAVDVRSVSGAVGDDSPSPPGHVELITGDITPEDRALLRGSERSFATSEGMIELWWPHLRISARPGVKPTPPRHGQPTVPLRGGHARIVQTLLTRHARGEDPYATSSELATDSITSPSTVSHLLAKLADHGLIDVVRYGRAASPRITDAAGLAEVLRGNTALDRAEVFGGYVYGPSISQRLANVAQVEQTARELTSTAREAEERGHDLAVTGLAGAAAYGAVRTGIERVDIWLRVPPGHDALTWLLNIGIEPLPRDEGVLRIGIDRHGTGVLRSEVRPLLDQALPCAEPVRVWADVQDAPRGPDIAHQLLQWQ